MALVCTEHTHLVHDRNGDTTLEVFALYAIVEKILSIAREKMVHFS